MSKVITVDFDDTLAASSTSGWGGTSLSPIERVINFVKEQHARGANIHIVTFRDSSEKKEVELFCRSHKIPASSIVCTEGKNKVPFIKRLGSKLHIDDSIEVCTLCIMAGIDALLVDHGQEKHNTTAKWIPKI